MYVNHPLMLDRPPTKASLPQRLPIPAATRRPPLADASVLAARRAFDTTSWSTDVQSRITCLNQLHQALTEHREELRELTIAEVGAPRMLTHGPQLDQPIELVRYYTDLIGSQPTTEDPGEIEIRGARHRRWVEKEAAGVVSAIIAYNFPPQLALAKLAPALAAGCTVVLKGAPDTPLVWTVWSSGPSRRARCW